MHDLRKTQPPKTPKTTSVSRLSLSIAFFLLVLTPLSAVSAVSKSVTLIPEGSTDWHYFKGTQEPSPENIEEWRSGEFDDASWETGQTPFFYGEEEVGGTSLDDMQGKYTTLYLRHEFQWDTTGPDQLLRFQFNIDDGMVVWINGQEAFRENPPRRDLNFDSEAHRTVSGDRPDLEITRLSSQFSDVLQDGTNVLAVQLFNANISSSDLYLQISLESETFVLKPPEIETIDPAPGELSQFDSIVLTFDEPVQFVESYHLLVNEIPASQLVKINDRTYRFDYPDLTAQTYEVRFERDTAIADRDPFPNLFDSQSRQWSYQLNHSIPPELISIRPEPGLAVNSLETVELRFNKRVTNIESTDLLLNGIAATDVSGWGAGPYRFRFPSIENGDGLLHWAPEANITDLVSGQPLILTNRYRYLIHSSAKPIIRISEIKAIGNDARLDANGNPTDWIELHNSGDHPVNLKGWSLTDNASLEGKWIFPDVEIDSQQYLVVNASGISDLNPAHLSTNFKLDSNGEFLGLYDNNLPRRLIAAYDPVFPKQKVGYTYGIATGGHRSFFESETPGLANPEAHLRHITAPVEISPPGGVYSASMAVEMSTPTMGAEIRYTLDGSKPTASHGHLYEGSLEIDTTAVFRAVAINEKEVISPITTVSYLYPQTETATQAANDLPVISIVGPESSFTGQTGIFGIGGGHYIPRGSEMVWAPLADTDYHNPSQSGRAWEREVSLEIIPPGSPSVAQINTGLRVHGSAWMRPKYRTDSKFGMRTYFRSLYGSATLKYPLIPESPIHEFDALVLRSGHNDSTNPFITDELARRLYKDMGNLSAVGSLASVFINGRYQGYYNPTQRIDGDWLRLIYDTDSTFDIIKPFYHTEGSRRPFEAMVDFFERNDLRNPANYLRAASLLDLTSFADYILLNLYMDTSDWTFSNWRVARENVPGAKFVYYVWDAEFAFGIYFRPVDVNSLVSELELGRDTEISALFNALKVTQEFQQLFADRATKHFGPAGALSKENLTARYTELKSQVTGVIPNFFTHIEDRWIPERETHLLPFLREANLFPSVASPSVVENGVDGSLSIQHPTATVYFTKTGEDPRERFTNRPRSSAQVAGAVPVLLHPGQKLIARAFDGNSWSAPVMHKPALRLDHGSIRMTEVMYNPISDREFEFIEITNIGTQNANLSGVHFGDGINYAFGEETFLEAGDSLVLVRDDLPGAFEQAYPGVHVFDRYGGKLSNSGETLVLLSADGIQLDAVTYDDQPPWPTEADGLGYSLELSSLDRSPSDPESWSYSAFQGGTPGLWAATPSPDEDADGDSIPDAWEVENGLSGNDASDAHLDLDGDGASNYAEYVAGTDPNSGEDVMRLLDLRLGSQGEILLSMPGRTGRQYLIERSSSVTESDWTEVARTQTLENDQTLQIVDSPTALAGHETRFYRVVVIHP